MRPCAAATVYVVAAVAIFVAAYSAVVLLQGEQGCQKFVRIKLYITGKFCLSHCLITIETRSGT